LAVLAAAFAAAGAPVGYDEYAGVGHAAWDRAFGDPALWPWLLAQRLRR